MKKREIKQILIALLVLILGMCLLYWHGSQKPDNAELIEAFGTTYYKPAGGEDRRVQEIRLSCFEGASKGAPEGNLWCQETVVEEWKE